MTNSQLESLPRLSWHLLFVSRIYSFIGWLGLLGSIYLLLAGFSASPGAAQTAAILPGIPWFFSPLLLAGWSVILLNFSKDIAATRRWATQLPGALIAAFSLISVPIGTAIGTYTLYVLFQYKRACTQLYGVKG